MKRRTRRVLIAVTVAVVFLGLLGYGVARRLTSDEVGEHTVAGVAVVAAGVERRTIEEILRYPGTLTPRQTVTVVPKMSGRVERIHVSEGDTVSVGTTLVTIDAESARLQADQAYAAWQAALAQYRKAERGVRSGELENTRASLAQAEDDLEVAQRNLERSKRLYEAGTIAKATYEEAEAAFRSATTTVENARRSLQMMEDGSTSEDLEAAQANAEALKAQYDLAALRLNDAIVTAPANGTVARILVDPGNLVGPGSALFALVSEDPIYARISIPERYYGRLAAARRQISVRVFPVAYETDEPFAGTVSSVATMIDAESRTFSIDAEVRNRDGRLKPGMYVNTEIVIGRRDDVLTLPEGALVRRNGQVVVFAVTQGNSEHASMRSVETGLSSDGFVEIVSGLDGDERIVIEGNAFLEDGQLVRLVTSS